MPPSTLLRTSPAPPSPAPNRNPVPLTASLPPTRPSPLPTTDANRQLRADIAASFQRVAVAHLEERCRRAVGWVQESHPQVGKGEQGAVSILQRPQGSLSAAFTPWHLASILHVPPHTPTFTARCTSDSPVP